MIRFPSKLRWFACGLSIVVGLSLAYWLSVRASESHLATRPVTQATLDLMDDTARLDIPLGPPQSGDWLVEHPEPPQSFQEYLAQPPIILTKERNKLYIVRLGDMSDDNQMLYDATAEYLGIFFGCEIVELPSIDLSEIPRNRRRENLVSYQEQFQSEYILHKVLNSRVPDDAVALIALTSVDLWPRDGWNFVFGQASLKNRVGIWSTYRYGNPSASKEAFARCLRRTLKVATHETGHMFSIRHCQHSTCLMQGSNSLSQVDVAPMHFCSQCLGKIAHATDPNMIARFERLAAFYKKHDLTDEYDYTQKVLGLLQE